MHLQFIGAARTVTGSKHLLECGGQRILIDCGLHQERELQDRNWDQFPVPPSSITAVVLTHGHLDHCGWLPRLVMQGFSGPVFATAPTAEIVPVILADSARLQVEDAEHKRYRHQRDGRPAPAHGYRPLYDEGDAAAACRLLVPWDFDKPCPVAPGISISFRRAGHIIGAANVLAVCQEDGRERRILFSGDLGVMNRPLMPDPDPAPACDAVVVESTYGDRQHPRGGDLQTQLAEVVHDTLRRGGNLVIPAFAIERTQEVLWRLHHLHREGRIPPMLVMVDSPMAIKVTEVFRRHPDALDAEARALFTDDGSPFGFHGVRMLATRAQSQSANQVRGAIIIAGSGMCTGGRIKHHLDHNLERAESTILFVGYQASGTLGRQLVEGARSVRLFGRQRQVRARVVQLQGFSGHADRDAITAWLGAIAPKPSQIFVVHGGPNVAQGFADHLQQQLGVPAVVPAYLDKHGIP